MDNVKNSDFRQKMSDVIGKFAGSRFVRAIMQAGYSVIAFTIVGAFFLLLTVIPTTIQNKAFVSFWMSTIGRFNNWFQVLYSANMGILALIFAGVFAYSYAEIYERKEKISISPTIALCLFLMSMFITVPQLKWTNGTIQFVQSLKADSVIGGGIAVGAGAISRIGSAGISLV
jgi:PTS system cellobiose-specific IIC component